MKNTSSGLTANPLDLFKICLKSYGVVAFAPHPVPATLMLTATFYYPLAGVMGIAGNLTANLTARWLHPIRSVRESGIFGVNGILVGLALAKYSEPSVKIWALLILGAGLAGILSTALAGYFAKYDLPILSIPFTAVAWLLLLVPGTAARHDVTLHAVQSLQHIDLWLFSKLPYVLFEYLKMFGSIFFQSNLLSGVLVLAAIAIYSRISVLAGLWGGFLGMLVYVFIHGSLIGFDGLNYVLIALAMGGFFVVHNFKSMGLMTAAILMVGLVEAGTQELFRSSGLPLLIFPFNLVAILLLFPLKNILPAENTTRPVPIPLYLIKSPESNLRWYRRWVLYASRQKTLLTLPFLGEWSVLQGNDGEWTHKGRGRYAWDFVVRDQSGGQLRGFGNRIEDYYAFGLPVLAPAPGTVYAVENRVNDNPPQTATTEQNWGNYVIIDHGNGEYSEISHFKQGSVLVSPGQSLQRGELIGYCGNSGRSPVPHIHYQLQQAGRLSAETLKSNFSEGVVDSQPQVHFAPETGSRVAPLETNPNPVWTLLGKEGEIWVYQVRESVFKYREKLIFSTDEFGNPAILGKDNRLWHLIDMPHFIEIRPDFKTYPSLINPSLWIDIVGEQLILPKILQDGFNWKDGEIKASVEMPGSWVVTSGNRRIVIDSSGRLSEMSLIHRTEKNMTLMKIQHKT